MEIAGNLLTQLFPLLLLVSLSFLLLLAWLFWILYRRGQAKRAGEAKQPSGGQQAWFGETEGSPPEPPPLAPAMAEPPASGDSVEVFRVLRDLADGSLVVEVEGRRYRRLADITDTQLGRRFVTNARALAHFAMLLKGPPPELEPPPLGRAPEPPPPAPPRVASSAPPGPLQSLRRARKAADGEPPIEMINLADQIESLLQYRLVANPALAGRSIHVRPSFKGGVRIVVDDTSYESVDDVPDEEIRAFIQATIREWNARQ